MMRLLGVSGGCALLFKSLGCDIIVVGYLDYDIKEVNCFVWLRDLPAEDTKSQVFFKVFPAKRICIIPYAEDIINVYLLKKKRLSLYLGIIASSSFNAQYIVAYFTVHVIPMAVPCFCKKKHSPKVNVFLFQQYWEELNEQYCPMLKIGRRKMYLFDTHLTSVVVGVFGGGFGCLL